MSADDVAIIEGWRPGALGTIVALHATYYARDWQLDYRFEAWVARELAVFRARYDRAHDCMLLALAGERVVGSFAIDGGGETAASEGARLRFFILDDHWRGRGLGRRLMERGMRFVAEKGFSRCYLTTLAGLDSARLFYERAGFRLVEEAPFDGWGPRIREQRFAWAR